MRLLRLIRKLMETDDEETKKESLLIMLDFFSMEGGSSSSSDQPTADPTPVMQHQIAKQVEDLEAMLLTLKTEMGTKGDNSARSHKLPPVNCGTRNTDLPQQTLRGNRGLLGGEPADQQLNTYLPQQTSHRGLLGGELTQTNNTGRESMLIRKDFKITGSINNQRKGDKPSLSYISLIHQIDAGMKQKYPDSEIVSAVIRALQPGMRLRTVLETLPNLGIPRLRLMLRSHYSEKGAAELFQMLTNSIQHPEEEAEVRHSKA